MPVYVVIETKVKDKEMYGKYIAQVSGIVRQFGGRYLARGGAITPLLGDWKPERMVLLEFDSLEKVQAWLGSPEYSRIAPLRTGSTVTRAVVLEGCAPPPV